MARPSISIECPPLLKRVIQQLIKLVNTNVWNQRINFHFFHYLTSTRSVEGEVIFGVTEIEPKHWPYRKGGCSGPVLHSSFLRSDFTRFWGQFCDPCSKWGKAKPQPHLKPLYLTSNNWPLGSLSHGQSAQGATVLYLHPFLSFLLIQHWLRYARYDCVTNGKWRRRSS